MAGPFFPTGGGGSGSGGGGNYPGSYPIVDADIATMAAIAYGKLNLLGSIVNADVASGAAIDPAKIAGHAVTDADFPLAPANIVGTAVTQGDTATVTNAMLAGSIAYSKLSLTGDILNADLAGSIAPAKISGTAVTEADTGTVSATMLASGSVTAGKIASAVITDTHIDSAAGIEYTKLSLRSGGDGQIVNADVKSSAAIAYSKLALSGSIVKGDIVAAAGIEYSKLQLTGSVVNADVATGAAIAYAKLNLAASVAISDQAADMASRGAGVHGELYSWMGKSSGTDGALGATFDTDLVAISGTMATPDTAQQFRAAAVYLSKGEIVKGLKMYLGTAAASTNTNAQAFLCTSDFGTTPTLTVQAICTAAFKTDIRTSAGAHGRFVDAAWDSVNGGGTTYTVPADGIYYLGTLIDQGTMPSFLGVQFSTGPTTDASLINPSWLSSKVTRSYAKSTVSALSAGSTITGLGTVSTLLKYIQAYGTPV